MSAAIDRKLAQARERLQNADATGARAVCQEILKRAPRNPQALVMLGISYLADNLPAEALAPLERAIAVEPRNGMALEHIGLLSVNWSADVGASKEEAERQQPGQRTPKATGMLKSWISENKIPHAQVNENKMQLFDYHSMSVFHLTWNNGWSNVVVWDAWNRRHIHQNN